MSESAVYKRLKEVVCRPMDRFERVENGMGSGMPDVNYCLSGVEGWIEIKQPTEPARPTTALFSGQHEVSVDQCNWMLRQSNAGGIAWLFIATKQRLLCIPGSKVGKIGVTINKMTTDELHKIARWKVLLPILDPLRWADLRELLTLDKRWNTYA